MVKMIVINRVSYLIFFSFCCISGMAQGSNGTNAGALYTEPATLISLGFEWSIEGDDNRNAKTQIFYRKAGSTEWQEGPPMLRIGDERINENALQYVTPRMFAGSLFDLAPDTRYVVRLIMTDSDGITGNTEQLVSVSTRGEPTPATDGNTYHVYPPSYEGQRIEPAYTGLLGAYYTGYSGSDNFNTYPPRVRPGDTLLVHAGVYQDNRYSYQGGLGTISSGSYFLTAKGTAERPIVIKSAGDGEVIFDGDGAYNLFNVMAADHHYFEGLTFRNTDLVFQAGLKNITGSSGLTIKHSRFEDIGRGIYTDWSGSKDFYIADNVFVGRFDPTHLLGFTGPVWAPYNTDGQPALVSEYAVKVYGSGHVVAYNKVDHFHDGIDIATYGNPDGTPQPLRERMPVSIDFYNNDISHVEDNCIESDGGAHNIRIFRNRCFNHGHRALSVQPMFGGPVYFMRNIVYHAPEGGAVKLTASSTGILIWHNTFIAPVKPMLLATSNVHYLNNLILGQSGSPEVFAIETNTNYSSSDYNGFRPNSGATYSFEWSTPAFSMVANFPGEAGDAFTRAPLGTRDQARLEAQAREVRRFETLGAYSETTGQDSHSILVDYDIFMNVTPTGPDPRIIYSPQDFDFRLRSGAAAVDAGLHIPGVNSGYTGSAPDLGAYESEMALPHYGPRN
jgi:hypothetical protein